MALANVPAPHDSKTNRSLHAAKVADYLRTMRVVSLVPSWTEYLHDLNVHVVGQTKFCVRPDAAFRSVPRIGGTKTVNVDKVMALSPDLVVANREENDQAQVTALMEAMPHDSVVLTDVRSVQEAWREMRRLGGRVDKGHEAQRLVNEVQTRWGEPRALNGEAAYAVWSSPWMAAGCDTFIHDVMRHWGIANAISPDAEGRYPTLGEGPEAGAAAASVWLLPSEPFPFKTRHLEALEQGHPHARFMLVDGEAFSWYGTRMLHVADHLQQVAHWVASQAPR